MKKILLLMLTILTLGFAAAPLSAQNNTLTVYDGTTTSNVVPAYIYYFDDFTRCQFVIPEADLGEMATGQISSITFYTTSSNVPYTTVSTVDVYLMTVDYTSISAYEDKDDATIVYTGTLEIASANGGGELTITFNSPYTYTGGNLLIGIENTTDDGYKSIYFYGQNVAGASIAASNGSSLANVSATQQNFIPKTTFTYTGGALCKTPKNLRVTDVTTSSATVIWHGDENASSYNILYMADSVTDWNNALTATSYDTTLNLSNLSTSTTYKVKVQTACSDNTETVWSSEKSFTTECEPIEITDSWFENFEEYEGGGQQPFVCWATPVKPNGPFVYCGHAPSCHSGVNSAEFKGASNVLVLPRFSNNLNTLRLTFYATRTEYAGGSVEVGVLTDVDDLSSFESVGFCGTPSDRGPGDATIGSFGNLMGPFDFNSINATSGRIALRYSNPSNTTASWNLDDFTVTFIPECAEPSGLANVNVTATTADVTWNEIDGTTYDLVYWKIGSTDTLIEYNASLTDSVYTLTDLFPSSSYTWFVRTNCGDGTYANSYSQISFSTPGEPVELPYERTFEEGEENPVTEFTFQGSGDNQWTIGTATYKPDANDPTTTGHSLYISSDNGTTNNYNTSSTSYAYAIMNVSFEESMEYHLSFDYKTMGEIFYGTVCDYLSVYLMDGSAEVPASGTPSGTALLAQQYNVGEWTHVDYVLENVTGTSKQIVFFWTNDYTSGTNPPAAIDNISITGSTCGMPTALGVSDVTTDGATLTWTENGSATSWTVYYKAASETGYTSVTASGTPSYELTGLSADSYYSFYVVADCDGTPSNPSAEYTFRTACGALTSSSYTTGFEDVVTATDGASGDYVNYVPCWSRLASNMSNVVYRYGSSSYAHGGSGCLDFNWTGGEWTIAIMPAFDASIPVNTLMLDFWLDKTGNSGTFELGVMTDPADSSTFEVVDTISSNISGNSAQYYERHIVSLASYTGSGQHIAFRVSNAFSCGYRMDDLVVSEIPQCMHPTALHTTSVGSDEVSIAWTELGDATSWTVAYGAEGFDPDGDEVSTSSTDETALTLTGLTPGATYDIYVMSGCGSDWEGPLTVVIGQHILSANGSDTLTTCGAVLYDDGGPTGNYSENCNSTLVIYPAITDMMVMLTGTASLENSYDHLYIYDGVGTAGTQLAHFTGENQTVNVMSTTGPLTLKFTSDYSTNRSGFELEVSCVSCFPPTNISVSDATTTSATISWSGLGEGYGVFVAGPDTNTYYTTGTTLDLTDLVPSSTYSVSIFTLCSTGDTSVLSQPVSFNTACDALPIPWTEDFESYSGSGHIDFICWDTPLTQTFNNGTYPAVYGNAAFTCHSGVNSMEMKANSGQVVMAVLPVFTEDIHNLRVSFFANATDVNYGILEVGVIPNPYDTSTFEPVGVCGTPGERGPWPYYGTGNFGNLMGPFDFNGVQATSGRIALRFTSNTPSYSDPLSWNLDDFTVELTPNCPSPAKTSVQATNVESTSATITFTDTDPTHHSWIVYYKDASDSTADFIPVTTNFTSVELNNLTPGTTYLVYVITDCGTTEENPDKTETISFATAVCATADQCAYTFNLSDSWGDGWNGSYITIQQNGIDVTTLTMADGNSATETVNLCDNMSTTIIWNSGTIYDDEASFTVNGPDGTPIYATSGTPSGTLTTFTTDCNGAGPIVTTYTVTLNTANATMGTVSPNTPTTVNAGESFTATANANEGYHFVAWTSNNTTVSTTNPYTFTVNADITLAATFEANSTPVEPCDVPANLHATNTDIHAIEIAWDPNANVSSWNVRYRMAGNGAWNNATANTNSYTISGLTQNTEYEIQVQANCGDNNLSEWSSTLTVTTLNDGIVNYLESSVTLFPNPAKEYVDIRVDGELNVTNMEVFDVYGKLLNTVNVIDNPTRINVNNLANGMYFVRVTTDKGTVTKTFVKK